VRFERSTDLLCGIALQTDAHKLAWDLNDYLTALEQAIGRALEEEAAASQSRKQQAAYAER
jgi:hypothetical protein